MNLIIWISKSLYKMIVILLLIKILKLDPNTAWYDILVILSFAASVFSSIPYSKEEK